MVINATVASVVATVRVTVLEVADCTVAVEIVHEKGTYAENVYCVTEAITIESVPAEATSTVDVQVPDVTVISTDAPTAKLCPDDALE